jgi:hypothetical protein
MPFQKKLLPGLLGFLCLVFAGCEKSGTDPGGGDKPPLKTWTFSGKTFELK